MPTGDRKGRLQVVLMDRSKSARYNMRIKISMSGNSQIICYSTCNTDSEIGISLFMLADFSKIIPISLLTKTAFIIEYKGPHTMLHTIQPLISVTFIIA